jgi:hypothetical protein
LGRMNGPCGRRTKCYLDFNLSKDLFDENDLEFLASQYQPFYEYLKEIEGLHQSTIGEFDPFKQHKHCRTLFGPAFGTHGASMISPSMNTLGKVPNFKFASFEAGVIRKIRRTWEDMKQKERCAKE